MRINRDPSEIAKGQLVNLYGKEVAAYQLFGPQVSADIKAELRTDMEPELQRGMARAAIHLKTILYESEKQEQETVLPFEETVKVELPQWFVLATVFSTMLMSIPFLVFAIFGQCPLWFGFLPWIFLLVCAQLEQRFKSFRVTGTAKVKRVKWHTFPDNERVFQDAGLGKPFVQQFYYYDTMLDDDYVE